MQNCITYFGSLVTMQTHITHLGPLVTLQNRITYFGSLVTMQNRNTYISSMVAIQNRITYFGPSVTMQNRNTLVGPIFCSTYITLCFPLPLDAGLQNNNEQLPTIIYQEPQVIKPKNNHPLIMDILKNLANFHSLACN